MTSGSGSRQVPAGPHAPAARERWRVRVRRGWDGPVLGAGVLVGPEHVLTCAHVVAGVEDPVVDAVEVPGSPSCRARLVDGMCVPEADGPSGDVALLRLDAPRPEEHVAVLRRMAVTRDRPVHAQGFPQGLDHGVWTRLTLFGHSGAEWLQMNLRSATEQQVRVGYSGAGVTDDATGDVLGLVVARYGAGEAALSWMIPVDAIAAHLPVLAGRVVGDTGIDPLFTDVAAAPAGDVGWVLDWLRHRGRGAAVLVALGEELAAVRQAVAAADRGGGVDLALDVRGRGVEEVARRIVDRAGLPTSEVERPSERLRADAPPVTVVLDGVDEAEEPVALVDDVTRVVLGGGGRIVLGFRREGSAGASAAAALVAGVVGTRLAALARRVDALPDGTDLQLRLLVLRQAAERDPVLAARWLDEFEGGVERAERRARRERAVEDDRGLLEASRAMANDAGLEEDLGLAEPYRRAVAALGADPVDPRAVHAAVTAYRDAVRSAREAERGREGEEDR
ncbi:S1 family peptidase [Saccharothrix syringae]|uniref:S1 family peptidase n=1 Tax=Saccharothrix syringae TaxID=103733 RepID=UPI0014771F99|nr:serine protease [Saccharothrix syringae]